MDASKQYCILCGAWNAAPSVFRSIEASAVQEAVRGRCAPTALHYAAVMAIPGSMRAATCRTCVNWRRHTRRVISGHYYYYMRKTTYTPLDSVLLYALMPGRFPEPDARNFHRLARVAADPSNAFAAIIPDQARAILRAAAENGPGAAVRQWHAQNDHTRMFLHSETARAVRRQILGAPVESADA